MCTMQMHMSLKDIFGHEAHERLEMMDWIIKSASKLTTMPWAPFLGRIRVGDVAS